MIYVCGPKDAPKGPYINTTSRSNNWSKGLSPFFLGPVKLYGDYVAKNVENAWQFAKVFPEHIGEDGLPTDKYFEWAKQGWNDSWAHRYPMGKGKTPKYSYWDGKCLDYISARKEIYVPLYAGAVKNSDAFQKVQQMATEGDIWLWDFDGYNHRELDMTYDDVMSNPNRKMGHAFVIAMLLDGFIQ